MTVAPISQKPALIASSLMRKPLMSPAELIACCRDDPSVRSLLVSNVVAMVLAVVEGWDLHTVMFIYWSQNVIIGVFNVLRMLSLGTVPAKEGTLEQVPRQAKYFLAGFFAVHYGFFQFGYYQFLAPFRFSGADTFWVMASVLLFFGHHLFSFLRHREREEGLVDIGTMMFFPYLRIIPMHLTIIFGGIFMMAVSSFLPGVGEKLVLLFFLYLKTGIDLKTHQLEHALEELQPLANGSGGTGTQ